MVLLNICCMHGNIQPAIVRYVRGVLVNYPELFPMSFASAQYVAVRATFCVLHIPSGSANKMGTTRGKILIASFSLFVALPTLGAQETGDLDAYKWRFTAMWWYSHPSGSFNASSDQVAFDLSRDFKFGSYSTFTGGVDWHFKRKHHLLFSASPINSSRSSTLSRDITFRGVTYDLRATVTMDLNSLALAPGYQWDFIRRRQFYVALATSFTLLNTTGSLTGTGSVNGVSTTRKTSGSILAPLPVLGATGRWYPIHDSSRLSIDGSFQGMYFFGYGDFQYARGKADLKIHKNLNVTAGYQMGTRLKVKGTSNQIGLRLTQTGPVVGL
jgi:hypothetical protein